MTLREKIGQRLIVGFPGTELTEEFRTFLKDYKIGNIILFERNAVNDRQLADLCRELRELIFSNTGELPFITIDQEGGNICRLKEDGVNVPGAMAIAATGDPGNAFLAGELTGRELAAMGINFDLAPVMDVNSNPANPIICERSYGDTPQQVADFAVEMMKGLLKEGVLACAKHFPGHGDTATDSHLGMPVVNKKLEELKQTELYPFERAVEAGIPAIMSTHIRFPAMEPENLPATLSKKILTGYLREQLGFEGMILSDCLEMEAIKGTSGVPEGACMAMEAGVDLVFISHTMEFAKEAVKELEKKAEQDPEFVQNIERSVQRILKYKKEYLGSWKEEDRQEPLKGEYGYGDPKAKEMAYQLLEQTIAAADLKDGTLPDLGEHPLFVGCPLFDATGVEDAGRICPTFPEAMQETLGGTAIVLDPDGTDQNWEKITGAAKNSSCVVYSVYHGDQRPGQLALAKELAKLLVPMIVISLKSPYELAGLPEPVTRIAAWEYSGRCFEVLREILAGKKKMTGKMPVGIE